MSHTAHASTIALTHAAAAGDVSSAATFHLQGSIGIVNGASVNHSSIGATVTFQPHGLPPTTQAIVGGSSLTSPHTLDAHFGMGKARTGTVEVHWPGDVRNRLYQVRAGEHLVLPEIPCSIDSNDHWRRYRYCVKQSLRELREADALSRHDARRLHRSAMRAFREERAH